MKSRKQIEAQQRIKRERDERQRKLEEEARLASARHRRALREKEERDAELQRQRVAYETQTRRRQMQHTAHLMAMCREKLAQTAADQWQSKQFLWCMRCDGLPDPTNLAQLNTFCYRWSEESQNTEPSIERLLSRTPQLNQVIGDLDALLENAHEFSSKIHLLIEMREKLLALMSQEIEEAVQSVLCDVEKHLVVEETHLNLQVCSESFSLGLGADTASNTTLTQHEFWRMSVTVDVPPEVNSAVERPVIVSLLHFRQQHPWQRLQVDGQLNMPTLLQPISSEDYLAEFYSGCQMTSSSKRGSVTGSTSKKTGDVVDMEMFLLVSGVYQLQLFLLPVQPRRYPQWTITPVENGGKIQIFKFCADFIMAEESDDDDKNDGDDAEQEGDNRDSLFTKLIHIKIKLSSSAFWLTPPQPVRYLADGTWTTKGVWDVRFHGEMSSSTLRFCLEEPSVVALTQPRKLNLPLHGWSLYPSQLRSAMINAIHKTSVSNKVSSAENHGGEDWEAGMSDESEDEDGEMGEQARHVETTQEESDDEDNEDDSVHSDSVMLTISGAMVSLDVEIQEKAVVLRKVRTIVPVKLQDIIGVVMTPFDLIKVLRNRGLEISPSERVRCQVTEIAAKNEAVERHLYRCMAIVATSLKFSFLSSRFNLQAGTDKCVFQYQMLQNDNQLGSAQMVLVTLNRTILLPSQESNPSLEQNVDQAVDGEFYADLLHALLDPSPSEIKDRITNPPAVFVETIYSMLAATMPLSTG